MCQCLRFQRWWETSLMSLVTVPCSAQLNFTEDTTKVWTKRAACSVFRPVGGNKRIGLLQSRWSSFKWTHREDPKVVYQHLTCWNNESIEGGAAFIHQEKTVRHRQKIWGRGNELTEEDKTHTINMPHLNIQECPPLIWTVQNRHNRAYK